MTTPIRVCAFSDIIDGQAKGVTLGDGNRRLDILIARRGEHLFAYVNSCPHIGTPLDWQADRFMSADGAMLQCATHGARFRVEDGLCVFGPCMGRRLERLQSRRVGDEVSVFIPPKAAWQRPR